MHKVKLLIGLLALVLFSCGDKEAEIPSYIYIDHIDLTTETAEGSSLHKITDVWVTIGGNLLGAFELPCTIPVLKEGEFDIVLRAGIKLNGISATRSAYTPFQLCTALDLDGNEIDKITLTRDSITSFNAKTEYKKDIKFSMIEDFEGAGWLLKSYELKNNTETDTSIYSAMLDKTDVIEEVYEGGYSGVIHLTKENHTVFIASESNEGFEIPPNGSGIGKYNYLELDYKSDVDLSLGLWFNNSSSSQIYWGGLRPNEDWAKVYLNIAPEQAIHTLSEAYGATHYTPYIRATLPDDMEEAYIYIDNIKLIHENE